MRKLVPSILATAALTLSATVALYPKPDYTPYQAIADVQTPTGYVTQRVRTVKTRDGVVVWPEGMGQRAQVTEVEPDNGSVLIEAATGLCACPPVDAGTAPCEVYDGMKATWAPAPIGASLIQSAWRGGCVPKACAVVAGDQGKEWPEECGPL